MLALWPAHYFGQLGRITSKSLLVLFLFTSAFFPFLVVMLIDVLDLLENLASMESDIVFYGTMTFGYLAVVWLLRPVISRLQILCIEPQES